MFGRVCGKNARGVNNGVHYIAFWQGPLPKFVQTEKKFLEQSGALQKMFEGILWDVYGGVWGVPNRLWGVLGSI